MKAARNENAFGYVPISSVGTPEERPAWMSDRTLLPKRPPSPNFPAKQQTDSRPRLEAAPPRFDVDDEITDTLERPAPQEDPVTESRRRRGAWGQTGARHVAMIRGVAGDEVGPSPRRSRAS